MQVNAFEMYQLINKVYLTFKFLLQYAAEDVAIILLGNKSDAEDSRAVDTERAKQVNYCLSLYGWEVHKRSPVKVR